MITQIVPLNVKQKTSRNKKKHTPILKLRKEKIEYTLYNTMEKSFKVMLIKYLLKNQMAEEKRKQIRQLKFIVQITELKLRSIFWFRVHLLADVNYELPLAFKVTPASKGEREVAEEIHTESEILLKNTKAVMADKGYDSVNFRKFIEEKGMIAIIPPRHMWGEEESRQYKDTPLYYNQDGQVFYRVESND